MNAIEKKEYLDLYLLQQAKIERLRKQIEINPDKKEKYLNSIKEAKELRDKIEDDIERTQGEVLKEILCQHYLCGRTLEETAYRLNYSKRQIERLHKKAIENVNIS